MTVYVSVANPASGQQIAANAAYTVNWSAFTDTPGWVLTGMRFRLSTSQNGTDLINDNTTSGMSAPGTWSSTRAFTIPANTMTAGNTYWLRLMGTDNGGGVGFVDVPISATGETVTPTITVPTGGAVITTPTSTVTWTLSTGAEQSHYHLEVLDGTTVVYNSGEVATDVKTVTGVPFPTTGVSRTIRVRAKRGALYAWSAWATVNVTVSHTPPPTPTITALVATDVAGIGLTHALVATITQPAPGGGVPAVATTEVYVRRNGDSSDGALVDAVTGAATSYTFKSPTSGVLYQMRLRVVSSDGRYAYSSWVTANAALALKGVVLYSLAAPTVVKLFRYNGDEASDDYQPEAELIQYDGREFPVVEFGTSSQRVLGVSIDLKTDADKDALRTMLMSRSMLLYRDRRGRKLYALVQADAFVDTAYGYSTKLTITTLDNPADRSV